MSIVTESCVGDNRKLINDFNMADESSITDVGWGNRKFYDIPENFIQSSVEESSLEKIIDCKELIEYIETNCLGRDVVFSGPFGKREGLNITVKTGFDINATRRRQGCLYTTCRPTPTMLLELDCPEVKNLLFT